jgi:hypothetical protein
MELAGAPAEALCSASTCVRPREQRWLREEHLASMAASLASTPCSTLASGQQPTSTPCLASTSRPAAGEHEHHLLRQLLASTP